MKKFYIVFTMCIGLSFLQPLLHSKALKAQVVEDAVVDAIPINEIQISNTYFNRFLRETALKGEGASKYAVSWTSGKSRSIIALGGEVPFDLDLATQIPDDFYMAHEIAVMTYLLDTPQFDDEEIRNFSLSYGMSGRNIPGFGDVMVGLYAGWDSYETGNPDKPLKELWTASPYLYIDAPKNKKEIKDGFDYSFYVKPHDDYKSIDKALVEVGYIYNYVELGLWYEQTRTNTSTNYEYSVYGFIPDKGNLKNNLNLESGFRFRAGNVFRNAFSEEAEIDQSSSVFDQPFAILEYTKYGFGFGLSYKGDSGLGWKAGLDYAFVVDDSVEGLESGYEIGAQLYWARDFINDTRFGQFADPKLFVVGVFIR